ncbi:ChaN family lipoprotein [Flavobacterium cheniae]|uniref:Putative iron-regulated protein n=1 Tax=Flavobacterium cheniae TaxID=295428 RepID=A0A562KA79_9FLAO|nr:ChaN family lipoprotein [Flavobacterium cheniae]TDR24663.1 putative iron-regulated protein [Flavobacterium cheniae]TWH92306.1 putative iron-regulated protein [Flavobacterium cheniae]
MKKLTFSIFLFATIISVAQDKKAYQIFDKKGKKSSYEKVLKASEKTDVVLFGEIHDNSLVHWLQLEFTKDLAQRKPLVLGAEMLEADNQKQLDQYLKGEINQKQLDSSARLWKNYKTDYKPLVDFAKEKKINFIATNVPRRYASLVFKKDLVALDSLSALEKSWIAPLPIEFDINLPGYKGMMSMQGGHAGEKMPKAQAIKDATMAYFINKNRKENSIFVHYNGTYHSDNYEGINWYLRKLDADIQIVTIAMVEQKDITKLEAEHYNKADFILVIDEDVTKTY